MFLISDLQFAARLNFWFYYNGKCCTSISPGILGMSETIAVLATRHGCSIRGKTIHSLVEMERARPLKIYECAVKPFLNTFITKLKNDVFNNCI